MVVPVGTIEMLGDTCGVIGYGTIEVGISLYGWLCRAGKIPYTIVSAICDGTVGDLVNDEAIGRYGHVGGCGQLRGLGG